MIVIVIVLSKADRDVTAAAAALHHAAPPAPLPVGLRVHRALSWLNRAEQEPEDHDARFIVMHGGATWHSSIYRDQIRDGANILGDVVPIVIHLMMENAQGVWGDACYPVVE